MNYYVTVTDETGEIIQRSEKAVELRYLAAEARDVVQSAQFVIEARPSLIERERECPCGQPVATPRDVYCLDCISEQD